MTTLVEIKNAEAAGSKRKLRVETLDQGSDLEKVADLAPGEMVEAYVHSTRRVVVSELEE